MISFNMFIVEGVMEKVLLFMVDGDMNCDSCFKGWAW